MEKIDLVKMISANAHARRYQTGDIIVREGDPAEEGLCFVLSGSVRIVQHQGERAIQIGVVQTGQFFGETALVLERNRTATAIADSTPVIVMFLNKERFIAEARTNHALLRVLTDEAIGRIERVMLTIIRQQKPVRITQDPSLLPVIKENRESNLELPRLLNHARGIFIGTDKAIFSQGQRNDGMIYLVTEGAVTTQRNHSGTNHDFMRFEAGDFFGFTRPQTVGSREYEAVSPHEPARVASFEEETLFRLLRLDLERFYFFFRSILVHLLTLDDSLRLSASEWLAGASPDQLSQEIAKSFAEAPDSQESGRD